MCLFSTPTIPAPPTPATFQPAQNPKDTTQPGKNRAEIMRRGLWASVFTGPQGIMAGPMTTGGTSGKTGA